MERERKEKTAADKRTTGQSVGNKGDRSYKVPAKAREYIIMQYVCDRKGDKLGGCYCLAFFFANEMPECQTRAPRVVLAHVS